MQKTFEERFWSRVNKNAPNGCWEWKGAKVRGYGLINRNGEQMLAHRASYELHFGKIPQGFDVLHKCDNPPCVNPAHLFLGTPADNAQDRQKKGRGVVPDNRGEQSGNAKLTEKDVIGIRRLRQKKTPIKEVAKKFGLSVTTISQIVHRSRWKHVS